MLTVFLKIRHSLDWFKHSTIELIILLKKAVEVTSKTVTYDYRKMRPRKFKLSYYLFSFFCLAKFLHIKISQ